MPCRERGFRGRLLTAAAILPLSLARRKGLFPAGGRLLSLRRAGARFRGRRGEQFGILFVAGPAGSAV
jgi:hypothetical protein